MISVLSGLLAGSLHVMAGPDHLAAVGPLAVDGAGSKWRMGIRWGLGHSSGVIVVGALALGFRDLLPLEVLSSWAERLVGVVLVGIGLWGLRKALRVHSHEHSHGEGETHSHLHMHLPPAVQSHVHHHAAFGIGILHGLAGGAHFLGVLPALAFPTVFQGLCYLGCYGVGTVVSMGAFSGLVGLVAARCLRSGPAYHKACMIGLSATSILVGVFWLRVG